MLTTIEATYENGQVIWTEQPPVQEKRKILVTFLDQEKDNEPTRSNVIRFGSMKGKISVPDDFNEPLDDLNDYMY